MAMVTPVRSTSTAAVASSARIDSDDLLVDALRGTRYDLLTSPASETSGNSLNASLDRVAGHSTSPPMATPGGAVALLPVSGSSFETPVPTARELSARLASLTQSLHKGTRPPWQLGSPALSPASNFALGGGASSPLAKADSPPRAIAGHEVDLDALSPQHGPFSPSSPRSLSPRDVKTGHPFDAPSAGYDDENNNGDGHHRRRSSGSGHLRPDNECVDRERASGSGDRTFSSLLDGGKGDNSSSGVALHTRRENEASSLVEDLRERDGDKGREPQQGQPQQPTRTVEAWLDDLKAGWAADFATAFGSIGAKVTDDFYHLREPKLAVLEAALQRHGAKVVQLRRITEAVKSLSYALSQADNNNNNNTSESGQGAGNGSSNSSSSSPDGDEQADSKRTKLQHSPVGSPPSLPPSPITDPPQASEASPKESPTQNSSSSATTSKRSPLAAATAAAVSKFTSELMARPWSRSRKPPPAPRARAVQSSNRPTPANDTAPETMDSSSEKLTVAESVTA